jgi:hypothetical protein
VAERIRMQRRLRRQRRLREAMLLDLGALVYELHRQGKRAPELLQEKAAALTPVDDKVRSLEAMLAGEVLPAADAAPAEGATDEWDADDQRVPEGDTGEGDAVADDTGEVGALADDDDDEEVDDPDQAEPALADGEEPRS